MSKFYVIGDEETGVIFIRLDPLRVSMMDAGSITTFGNANNQAYPVVFGKISKAVRQWIQVAQGSRTVNNAEFCYVADFDDTGWHTDRNPYPPVKDGLRHVVYGDQGYDTEPFPADLSYTENEPLSLKKLLLKKAGQPAAHGKKKQKKGVRGKAS